jgi:hypothetical protein
MVTVTFANFWSGHGKVSRKARFQEAWNSSNLDVAAFLAALQETGGGRCFEDVDEPWSATEETGTVGDDETVEDYKRFLGLELDDVFQDPGSNPDSS